MSRWKMPKWMEPYRKYIVNTGGNSIEDLANGDSLPWNNLVLYALQACIRSQITLLMTLHKKGLLK